MACSKYASTKETTNAARVVRLLLDPCTDMLRDVLRHYIPETIFAGKLQSEVLTIKPLLNSAQRSLLYPHHGSFTGNYQDFDISLLYILLRNISKIPQHAKGWGKTPDSGDRTISANIERIRNRRNEYIGHTNQSSMPDPTFNSIWQEVRQIATEVVKDVGITTNYANLIDKLEHETMDPEQEVAYLKKIDNTEKTIENLIDQQEKQSQLIINQNESQNELYDIQNQQRTTIAKHEEQITEQSRVLSEQRATVDKHEKLLTKHVQAETEHGPTIAKHAKLINEQGQVSTEHRTQLQLLDSSVSNLSREAEENRENQREILKNQADVQQQLNEIKHQQGATTLKHEGQLAEQRQVQTEHGATIVKHEELITEQNQVLSEHGAQLKLFTSSVSSLSRKAKETKAPSEGPEPFKYTLESVFNDIENMRMSSDEKIRYCILAYVFIHTQINTKNIDLYDFNEHFEEIANTTSLGNINDQDIKNAIENLQRPYLHAPNEDSVYRFSNDTVYDAVLISFGQLDPATVIKKCNASRFIRLIRTEKYEQKSGEIILKIPKRLYQDLVKKLFHIYTNSNNHFNENNFLEHPCTDDDKFTDYVFFDIQAEERLEHCCKLIHSVPHYNKPGLINSMLKYHCSDCTRKEANYLVGNNIVLCHKHSCNDNEFVLTDADIIFILDGSIFSEKVENVSTICRYLGTQMTCDKYFSRDVKTGHSTECTVLQNCVFKDWKDTVNIILSVYKPSTLEVCSTLSWCVYRGKSDMTLELCRYICTLGNANEYFDRYIWEVQSDYKLMSDSLHKNIGFTILHCCVINGWNDPVSVILGEHTPTKTDKNWTCAHLAAFFGRVSLLKKFVDMGQTVTDKTEEGYSVFRCLLLGMRYIDQKSATLYSLDENETSNFTRKVLLDYNSYKESFDYLVSVISSSSLFEDVSLALDRHGNRVIHYLVINNCDEMLDMLLKFNIDISQHRNKTDLPTALHLALYLGRHNMLKKLWMTGLRPESSDITLMEAIREGCRYCGKTFRLCGQWKEVLWPRINYNGENLKFSAASFLEVKFGNEDDFYLTQRYLDKLLNQSSIRLKTD